MKMTSDHCSRAFRGWLAGCGAAAAVIGGGGLGGSAIASGIDIVTLVAGAIAVPFLLFPIFLVVCLVTGIPAAVVIWISEELGIRSILFFGTSGAAIGGLIPSLLGGDTIAWLSRGGWLLLVAGFAAGVAYWFVAGKYAGGERHLPVNRA
jgi:hypothetical protein